MPKKKSVTTRRGQHHKYKLFRINLVKDNSLTKIDANVLRKYPDSFEKRKVRFEKRNADPLYFRQTVCQAFQSLNGGVEFSFWRLSKDNPTLIPFPPEIDNAASLCNFDELNRSCLYIRLLSHRVPDLVEIALQHAAGSSTEQGTNTVQVVPNINGNYACNIEVLNKSSWLVSSVPGSDGQLSTIPTCMSEVSPTVAPFSLQPTTTTMEDVTTNEGELLNMSVEEKSSMDRNSAQSSCAPKKRKIVPESDSGFIEEKQHQSQVEVIIREVSQKAVTDFFRQHQSSSGQENDLINGPMVVFRNDHVSNATQDVMSPVPLPPSGFGMPQMNTPWDYNSPCYSSQSNMAVTDTLHTPYFPNFADSAISPEQRIVQYSHQMFPSINPAILSIPQHLDLCKPQTQPSTSGLEVVSQDTSNSESTCRPISQEDTSNGANLLRAQKLGEIHDERFRCVQGVVAMNNKVYIACEDKHTLLVYSSSSPFQKQKDVIVKGMKHPQFMSSCAEKNCIFISDGDFTLTNNCIWIVKEGDVVVCEKFVKQIDCYSLSVTRNGELLIVDKKHRCIHLYNSDGRCFCCVDLPFHIKLGERVFAVKSFRESFYVSSDWKTESDKRTTQFSVVYEVSTDKDIVQTFGGRVGSGPGQLSGSDHPLAVDKSGRVIVGDEGNHRVLMLDSNLQLLTTVLDKEDLMWTRCGSFHVDVNADLILANNRDFSISLFSHSQLGFSQCQRDHLPKSSSNVSSRAISGTDEFILLCSIQRNIRNEEIIGVATLMDSNTIYVLSKRRITVYNRRNPCEGREIFVGIDFRDLAANVYDECLHVTDRSKKCVWSVGMDLRSNIWLEGIGSPYTLSVTKDGSVLMLRNEDQSLNIYNKEGLQLKIRISSNKKLHFRHAVKLSYSRGNETYLVCHGHQIHRNEIEDYDYDSDVFFHELFVVSACGVIIQAFGAKFGPNSDQLNLPSHVVIYRDNAILVADCKNHRVLRLDHQLNLLNIPFSKDAQSIEEPFRLCYSENTGQIMIASLNSVDIFIHDDFLLSQGELSTSNTASDAVSMTVADATESEIHVPCVHLIDQIDSQILKDEVCLGTAVLQDHMYLIYRGINTVYVHSIDPPYILLNQVLVEEVVDPRFIVASVEHNCVYIADIIKIWRLLRNGQERELFIDGKCINCISVTEEGHLLVLTRLSVDLYELLSCVSTYDAEGRCIQIITIDQNLSQAVKSGPTKVFVNDVFAPKDDHNSVMMVVSLNGTILHTYGPYVNEYFECDGMTLGEDDQIFVIDKANGGRVLVFGSRAQLIGVLLSQDDLKNAKITGLCYIKDKKQLVVVGSDQIKIYQLNKNRRPQMNVHGRKAAPAIPACSKKGGDSSQLIHARMLCDEFPAIRAIEKIRDKLYVLRSTGLEVWNPEMFTTKIHYTTKEIDIPENRWDHIGDDCDDDDGLWDMGASETDLCLYVTDRHNNCVWSVTMDHRIKKLVMDIGTPFTLSVNKDGSLCILSNDYKSLEIYDRSGNKKNSIPLPRYMKYLLHAVQTPKGTYIISWTRKSQEFKKGVIRRNGDDAHLDDDEDEEETAEKEAQRILDGEDVVFEDRHKNCARSGDSDTRTLGLVCEVMEDGSVLRSFNTHDSQTDQVKVSGSKNFVQLGKPCHLAVDEEGRVFVADYLHSNRVLLLDSQLKNVLVNLTEQCQLKGYRAKRLCYDKNTKELHIVECGKIAGIYGERYLIICIRMKCQ